MNQQEMDAWLLSVKEPTLMVVAVRDYCYRNRPGVLTMSDDKYARFVNELPQTWAWLDGKLADEGVEHRKLCGWIVKPLDG